MNDAELYALLASIKPLPPRQGDARLHNIIDKYLVLRKGLPNGYSVGHDQELELRWPDVSGIVLGRACSLVEREKLVRKILLDMLREAAETT